MWSLSRVNADYATSFLEKQKNEKLTYERVKGTLDHDNRDKFLHDPHYKGFDIDQRRVSLGSGKEIYEKAVAALRSWKQFDMDWVCDSSLLTFISGGSFFS